ncbi:ubiquinone biosynthesis O-methyltransferase, mitochondrial [Daphnia magna]|uniref:Ubiquinone biosynthesis O-methyltransferase, mitochondrial n=1 Tax=Daphnia magna TaxID=35525 RepID=A0A0P4WW03_9CRUS|nr:ubiquinone biosynthesis O-methyltransferase, mitochondrial [Daphnia magna]KZS21431.1 Ubiquinone biosynthesis O-methyltransferase, mitochondrial [Daphnia magna]
MLCFKRTITANQRFCRNISLKSTVSVEELRKFNAMAKEWWDVDGPVKPLHSFNKLRVPFLERGIYSCQKSVVTNATRALPLAGCKILDVGCGAGILSENLGRLGASVTGIDPSEDNIRVALLRAHKMKLKNVSYAVKTVEDVDPSNAHSPTLFDAVVASEVIEHVENQKFFVKKCSQLLKPGGSLFITTQNRTAASWAFVIFGAEYVFNIIPRGTHEWTKFLTPDELIFETEKNGCQLRQLRGYFYNPFIDRWTWSKSTSVNYALHVQKSHHSKW